MNLYKSNENRMFYGVCGGIAEKYAWDPSVVRIVVVLATVCTGFWLGVLGYIAASIIIPDANRKVQRQ
jgi:phage shock protein PspC (stress-responsive transcriptional regulator)